MIDCVYQNAKTRQKQKERLSCGTLLCLQSAKTGSSQLSGSEAQLWCIFKNPKQKQKQNCNTDDLRNAENTYLKVFFGGIL